MISARDKQLFLQRARLVGQIGDEAVQMSAVSLKALAN